MNDINDYRNILHEKIEQMCCEQDYKELCNLYKSASDYLWLIFKRIHNDNVKKEYEESIKK